MSCSDEFRFRNHKRKDITMNGKDLYIKFMNDLTAVFLKHNPMRGISPRGPDEYFSEALGIMPRLLDCTSPSEAAKAAYDEFVSKFKGAWYANYGGAPLESYQTIGSEVWRIWQGFADEDKKELEKEIRARNPK